MRVRLPRVRFTIRRLMVVVALAGFCSAAARAHVLLGVLAGATSILAVVRAFLAIDGLGAKGGTLKTGRKVSLLLDSLGVSATLITAAMLGYLAGSMAVLWLVPDAGLRSGLPSFVVTGGGLLAAFGVAYRLRRFYWPPTSLRQAIDAPAPPPPD